MRVASPRPGEQCRGKHRKRTLQTPSTGPRRSTPRSSRSACGRCLMSPMQVTMRGETGERKPWQVPMGQATPEALRLAGVRTLRLERAEEASAVTNTAAKVAFEEQGAVALLISQQLIGVKSFEEKR